MKSFGKILFLLHDFHYFSSSCRHRHYCGKAAQLYMRSQEPTAPKCVKLLLNAHADPNAMDKKGVTPLLLAGAGLDASQKEAIANYEEVVKLLIAAGANGNANNDGMATSALLNAVFLGSLTALEGTHGWKGRPQLE